jgi:hypothetical protein
LQGPHCIQVVAKLLANSSEVYDGTSTIKMPANDIAATTNVCFYKSSKQASADFGFDLCSAKCECVAVVGVCLCSCACACIRSVG